MHRFIPTGLTAAALLAGCGGDAIQSPERLSGVRLQQGAVRPAPEFTFTAIDVPKATLTTASGVNARGDVVGSYRDANNRVHGYVLRKGEFTTIDVPFPGVVNTEARGISPDGDIVGTYRIAGERPVDIHGFLLTKHGEFVRADFPGRKNTIPQRISPDGTIYGCYHDDDTMASMKGMAMGPGGTSETAIEASMHNGASPDGRRIAGLFTDMMTGRQDGYLIEDGAVTVIRVPESTMTAAWDMNPAGDIVGVYRNASGFHGFVLRDGRYTSVDVPFQGARDTRAVGINALGWIVGTYVGADGRTHGFLAQPSR